MYADGKFERYLKYKYLDSALTDHIKNSKINPLKVLIMLKMIFLNLFEESSPKKSSSIKY